MTASPVVPHLNTMLAAPLNQLEKHFLKHHAEIEKWFEVQWRLSPPPVYGSVDLRNAGFKLAPIDMNLFPAGFNNLNPTHLSLSVRGVQKVMSEILPSAKQILIIPESHTRNLFYWESVALLQKILHESGFVTRLGSLNEEVKIPMLINLTSGLSVLIEPLQRVETNLSVDNFIPDLILLNNDLSEGIPPILGNLSQPLIPPAELGWSARLKSLHFRYYAAVTEEFAQAFHIDPWLIAPLFRQCGNVNFMQQEGIDCVVQHAENLMVEIQKKYAEYQLSQQPFLIVKADAGTYGMAVMTVRDPQELKMLNRKQRTRMSSIKGGKPVTRVIIQEGVYSFETWGENQAVAEPVVYLFGNQVVGGFYRIHHDRGPDESLNTPGMQFEPLAFSQSCDEPCASQGLEACQNRFYLYGLIAKLSMLAAAREMKSSEM